MKKIEWELLEAVAVLVLLFAVCSALQHFTDQGRSAAIERFRKPDSIVWYEKRMSAKARQEKGDTQGHPSGAPASASDTIAADERHEELSKGQQSKRSKPDPYVWIPIRDWTPEMRVAYEESVYEYQNRLPGIRVLANIIDDLPHVSLSDDLGSLSDLEAYGNWALSLCFIARDEARQADRGKGLQDLVLTLKLADGMARCPNWHSYEALAIISQDVSTIYQETYAPGDASCEQVSELLAHLAKAYHRDALADSLGCFVYSRLNVFSDIRERPLSEVRGFKDKVAFLCARSPLIQPYLNMNEVALIETENRLAELVGHPPYESKRSADQIRAEIEKGSVLHKIADRIALGLFEIMDLQAPHEATVDLMRIGISLEVYYAENGAYPATLEAISGYLGGSVPLDAFTGVPYRYEPHGDSFDLRSAGTAPRYDVKQRSSTPAALAWRGE